MSGLTNVLSDRNDQRRLAYLVEVNAVLSSFPGSRESGLMSMGRGAASKDSRSDPSHGDPLVVAAAPIDRGPRPPSRTSPCSGLFARAPRWRGYAWPPQPLKAHVC